MSRAAGLEVSLSRPYLGEPLPQPQSAKAIVLTGGPDSVCDLLPGNTAYLSRVVDFTRLAIERWTPIIGICLGHQIIARALNGRVVTRTTMEVGVRRIYAVTAAGSKRLSTGAELQAFVFHRDHVPEAPPGCVVTFRSGDCAVEGFSHRVRPVHGFQFHPEIDNKQAYSILRWWYNYSDKVVKHKFQHVAAFDARPAQSLLMALIERYALRHTVPAAVQQ